ncbi:hypothetical protein DPMN_194206 [Dreissena polymorpha]|uniref:Uncharacterized protein n=1 Tax=Dreissena polymorpha TaxID=45954 RepID=A0A9D3Y343_DREPO|nr:hypothetical protein DPMN_194206 [Dreissena polymorpha]
MNVIGLKAPFDQRTNQTTDLWSISGQVKGVRLPILSNPEVVSETPKRQAPSPR